MLQPKHCDLCIHSKRDLKTGLTCGLTGKKPNFKSFCSKIVFSDHFKIYASQLLADIQNLQKRKTSIYSNVFFLLSIGITIIVCTFSPLTTRLLKAFYPTFDYASWKYFTYMFILNFIGIQIIFVGIYKVYKYKKDIKKLKSKKGELNSILNNYNTSLKRFVNQ